jgi:hypothetical protein
MYLFSCSNSIKKITWKLKSHIPTQIPSIPYTHFGQSKAMRKISIGKFWPSSHHRPQHHLWPNSIAARRQIIATPSPSPSYQNQFSQIEI